MWQERGPTGGAQDPGEYQQTAQREEDADELCKVNGDPAVAVRVRSEDDLVVVFLSRRVEQRRDGIEEQARDHESAGEADLAAPQSDRLCLGLKVDV